MTDLSGDKERGIVFDCFGVLYLDTHRSLLDAVTIDKHAELSDIFRANNYGYFTHADYIDRVADLTSMTAEQVEDYMPHEHQLNTKLIDYIRNELRPTTRVGLLTNMGRGWIDSFFSRHDLHDLFDAQVISGEVRAVKPFPEVYELICAELCLPPESCVHIDDIEDNCRGAEAIGMKSVHFRTTQQCMADIQKLI